MCVCPLQACEELLKENDYGCRYKTKEKGGLNVQVYTHTHTRCHGCCRRNVQVDSAHRTEQHTR